MMICKGRCDSLETYNRYNKSKYCSICSRFLVMCKDTNRCPCCGVTMRCGPKNNKPNELVVRY